MNDRKEYFHDVNGIITSLFELGYQENGRTN
jgi:hypothetical protein